MDTNQASEQEQKTVEPAAAETTPEIGSTQLKLEDLVPPGRAAREHILLQAENFKHKQRLADLFAASGCFEGSAGQPRGQALAQAFVRIELGEAMGFTAAEAMAGIDLINGKPAVQAQLRASRMQRAGFHWDINWFEADGVCSGCRLWLYRNGKPVMQQKRNEDGSLVLGADGKPIVEQVSEAFLKADAERLKTSIWEGPPNSRTKRQASVLEKDNWKGSPRNMYFARAVSNLQRFHAPGVLSGDIPSVEEAMDFDRDRDGQAQSEPTGSTAAQQEVRNKKLVELGGEPVLTDVEQESLFKVVKESGVGQSDAARVIKAHGFASFADITRDKLIEIIESIRASKPPVPEEKKERPSKPTFGGPKP